jgi:monoterpene epsilon-lactone hydrolase
VDAGGRPAEWVVAPGADAGKVVFYLHGGGYETGSCATHRPLASQISAASGARVLTLDYRLSPEDPHPAALDDSLAAWAWLLAQPDVTAARTVIAGDSAGGGLAAATILALKDAGQPLPAALVGLSAFVDLACTGASHTERAEADPMIDKGMLAGTIAGYVAGADPRSPLISPLYGDWSGAPPMLLQVGTEEVLLDDSRLLAEAATKAGVDVTLEEWDGMVHVWHFYCGLIDGADEAVARIGAYIRQQVG